MTKDREDSIKTNKTTKKRSSSNKSFHGFVKKQADVVLDLRAELQDAVAEKQQNKFATMEKNKCIQELQKSIEERDNQIQKLNVDLAAAREENGKTLQDFCIFKEKFFELETHYNTECQKQTLKIDSLKQQLERQQSQENEQVRELSNLCEDLKQQLHDQKQAFAQLALDYSQLTDKCEKNKQEFMRQQKHFENYKEQVEVEKNAYDKEMNTYLDELKQELLEKEEDFVRQLENLEYKLLEKDELLTQCIKDKEIVEEEKNHKIQELNYKISQIEKVFGQPTKTVNPIVFMPGTPETAVNNQQTTKISSNVAITKPQLRKEFPEAMVANKRSNSSDNSDIQIPETSNRLRSKKNTRSVQQSARSANLPIINTKPNSKKRTHLEDSHLLRNPSPPRRESAFSTPSSEEADGDDLDIYVPQWRPDEFVAETETDASEGLHEPKRSKK